MAQIREVVSFRELDVDATPGDDELTYLCFGFTGRLHLVHQIGARPSFDQVLTGRIVAGTVRDQAGRRQGEDAAREHFETAQRFDNAQSVQLRGRRDVFDERLTPGETVDGLFPQTVGPAGSHGFIARLEVGEEVYLEREELGAVASRTLTKSGRAMLEALIAGQRDPDVLADLAMGRMRAKIPDLVRALDGRFDTHHAVHLRGLLDHIDWFEATIAALDTPRRRPDCTLG